VARLKKSTATGRGSILAALVTAELVVLGRAASLWRPLHRLANGTNPARDGCRGRIVVFAAILVGATLALTLNNVARDFMVRLFRYNS
jgi:hypothetical protein